MAVHAAILFQSAGLNYFKAGKKNSLIQVSYVKQTKKEKIKPVPESLKMASLPKGSSRISMQKGSPPPFIDIDKDSVIAKGRMQAPSAPVFVKPALAKPEINAVKKKISLPPVDIDKINNPSYLSYYQIVREKIRRAAYLNYTRTETGEIYLSFVINNDGVLKEARLVQDKSANSQYLRDIALKSIWAASPFPAFAKELDYQQLSFNVVISFEIE